MPLYTEHKKIEKTFDLIKQPTNKQSMSKNSNETLLPNELNAEEFEVTDIKVRNDRKNSYLLQNGNAIYAETPWLRAPFGVSGFTPKGSTNTEWSLNLSASPVGDDKDDNDLIEQWFQQWCSADELMAQHGLDNSEVIFGKGGKKKTKETVEALYVPVVKGKDNEEGYPLRIQPKVAKARDPEDKSKALDTVPNVSVFMEGSDKRVEIESFEQLEGLIRKGSVVKAIIQPRTWYIAGKFGLSLAVISILVRQRKGGRPEGYAFSTPVEEENSGEDGENEGEEYVEEQPDSDAEEEEEEADEDGDEVEE